MNDYIRQINSGDTNNKMVSNMSTKIEKARYNYNDFVDKMNKSDFCNSSRRYIAEIYYVRKLKELYSENNCPDSLKEMSDRETFILKKLEDEFGIKFI